MELLHGWNLTRFVFFSLFDWKYFRFMVMVFKYTFNNISVISYGGLFY